MVTVGSVNPTESTMSDFDSIAVAFRPHPCVFMPFSSTPRREAFHLPLQVGDPTLHLGGCDDLALAVATRDTLRRRIAAEQAIMIPANVTSPHAGRVTQVSFGFQFAALSN